MRLAFVSNFELGACKNPISTRQDLDYGPRTVLGGSRYLLLFELLGELALLLGELAQEPEPMDN